MRVTSISLDESTEGMLNELAPEPRQRSPFIRRLIAHAYKLKQQRELATRKKDIVRVFGPRAIRTTTPKGKK